jgi:hypothetical protein
MRSGRLATLSTVTLIAVMGMAGCGRDADSTAGTRTPTAGSATPEASTPKAGSSAVCAAVAADIQAAQVQITEAEAIGPPAGHHAVSAAYSAGAAAIYAHITAEEGTAAAAGKGVADAMSAIADRYVDARSAPDKAPLTTAIDRFKAACAGS